MKKCQFCGAVIEDNEKCCPQCGVKLSENDDVEKEVFEGEVVDKTASDEYLIEESKLNDFEKRAKTNFNLSIVCTISTSAKVRIILTFTKYSHLFNNILNLWTTPP